MPAPATPSPRRFRDKASAFARLLRLDRPVGSLLLLWPTLWALWIAGDGAPDPKIVLIFIAGTFVMRAAGCAINDYADRHWDGAVERTKDRPLATGALLPRDALLAFAALALLALLLVLQLNRETILFSLGALAVAAIYPFTKRVSQLPQLVLGIAFSWGIPMAFVAHHGTVGSTGWMLFFGNLLWVVAYDTFYALADRPDDLNVGIKSTATLFGRWSQPVIALLQLLALLVLLRLSPNFPQAVYYQLGLGLAATSFVYQHWLASSGDRAQALNAFLNNIWTGAFIYFGVMLAYF